MFTLLSYRVLVLVDDGSENTGVIVEHKFRGYRGLLERPAPLENDDDLIGPDIFHSHIVFVKEMASEVEIDGIAYLAMHQRAIMGYLD